LRDKTRTGTEKEINSLFSRLFVKGWRQKKGKQYLPLRALSVTLRVFLSAASSNSVNLSGIDGKFKNDF
jgi:hypothetical protein